MTTIVAQLRYRGSLIDVELIEGEAERSFVIRCPACQTRSRLNEGKHCVTWEMQVGRITVNKSITCPNPQCGWHVMIERNVVLDVEDEPPYTGEQQTSSDNRRGAFRGSYGHHWKPNGKKNGRG